MNRTHQTQRRSIRLEQFDYSSAGAYFITICAQMRDVHWFGTMTRDGMVLNNAGTMVQHELGALPNRFPNLELDEYIIMPDHIHAVFVLRKNINDESNPTNRRGDPRGRPATLPKPSITFAENAVIDWTKFIGSNPRCASR
jgi:hypothetical protein